VAAPTFFNPMFVSPPEVLGIPLGVVLFAVAIIGMGAGFYFIRKIVDIEV
jgi:TRAP-type C4-dicarboxylate transport system permease small subunit